MATLQSVFNNQFAISQFDEYYLPCINRNTFEKEDSITAFKKKYKQDIFKKDTLHVILGLDSGLLVNYILESPQVAGSKYIFVELPEVMSMLNIDIPEEQQHYLKVLSLEELNEHIESGEDDLFLIKDQIAITLSLAASAGVVEEYSGYYSQIYKLIKQQTTSHKANFTQKSFFVEQFFNVVENNQPASILKNQFAGKTAIVIGGGPSLDEHIDWIKANYEQLFILTVSRFASKLSAAGIPAHIIVSVDPQDTSFEVNRDMMGLANESLFINSHHVNHRIIAQWNGKSLFLGNRFPWEETNNILTIGPTVTNSAIRVAIDMGFKQVLLSGVDLCHSSAGVTHAKGSVEASAGSNNSIIHEWVETYSGSIAETPIQLIHAALALKEEAETYPNVEIVNLSINAAKIQGINHIPKEQVSIVSADCSPSQLLDMVPSASENKQEKLQRIQTELSAANEAFKAISKLAIKALHINNEAKKLKQHSAAFQAKASEIDKIEQKINKKFPKYNMSIKVFGYFEFTQFLTTKKTQDWSFKQMNSMTHLYYSAYQIITEQLQELTETALDIVKLRREEISDAPSIELITEGWKKHNQPGRVNIFQAMLDNTVASSLTLDEKSKLKSASDSYQDQLTSFAHPYFSMKKKNQNLDNTLAKILDLKQHKNIDGLTLLTNNIEPLIANDKFAHRLFHLALHYVHFLENNFDAALTALLEIEPTSRTEVELKQQLLLALKLHKIDLAEETITSLAQYSDEYYPQHAHILSLQGKNQQALDLYLNYLDKYPTDESTLIKLGVFLAGLGQIEGAKSAFDNVMQINPDNVTARNYLNQLATGNAS
ncbi:6-hydroxymethylpterin diphosphokinase MptE-like protein [Shewanella sp. WPAGA9]|uniref:6-hydroxymethylpterin diphosphokinase MptE-like protein n=1 Tax=Shewanella sp. ENK2 TaxID=2775245 RepID=UPI00177E3B34|nr:6-hydroxymethylpterin diphosphokinase MptE-like protein [Shewanella sp. WPAGA9]